MKPKHPSPNVVGSFKVASLAELVRAVPYTDSSKGGSLEGEARVE